MEPNYFLAALKSKPSLIAIAVWIGLCIVSPARGIIAPLGLAAIAFFAATLGRSPRFQTIARAAHHERTTILSAQRMETYLMQQRVNAYRERYLKLKRDAMRARETLANSGSGSTLVAQVLADLVAEFLKQAYLLTQLDNRLVGRAKESETNASEDRTAWHAMSAARDEAQQSLDQIERQIAAAADHALTGPGIEALRLKLTQTLALAEAATGTLAGDGTISRSKERA